MTRYNDGRLYVTYVFIRKPTENRRLTAPVMQNGGPRDSLTPLAQLALTA
jgi:hypothetical protein